MRVKKRKLENIFKNAVNNFRYRKAIKTFEKFLKKNKEECNNEKILTELGLLYDHLALQNKPKSERLRLERKALMNYKKALSINPKSPSATWGIGRIWWHRKSNKAIAYAKKAYRLSKKQRTSVGIYTQNVGTTYKAIGNYRMAEFWLKKGLKMEPRNWELYINLISFYLYAKKDYKLAKIYAGKLKENIRYSKIQAKSKWRKMIIKMIKEAEKCRASL